MPDALNALVLATGQGNSKVAVEVIKAAGMYGLLIPDRATHPIERLKAPAKKWKVCAESGLMPSFVYSGR